MITKDFTTNGQVSPPIFVGSNQVLSISIRGTFTGTLAVQRCLKQYNTIEYPAAGDSGWATVESYTAVTEQQVDSGDNAWYRLTATAAMTGTANTTLKV